MGYTNPRPMLGASSPSPGACKNFLASQISMTSEPFQRTDLSMQQPLGPTNYTGSYTSSKNTIVVIGAWCHRQQKEER
jgi:hypothetical protein